VGTGGEIVGMLATLLPLSIDNILIANTNAQMEFKTQFWPYQSKFHATNVLWDVLVWKSKVVKGVMLEHLKSILYFSLFYFYPREPTTDSKRAQNDRLNNKFSRMPYSNVYML